VKLQWSGQDCPIQEAWLESRLGLEGAWKITLEKANATEFKPKAGDTVEIQAGGISFGPLTVRRSGVNVSDNFWWHCSPKLDEGIATSDKLTVLQCAAGETAGAFAERVMKVFKRTWVSPNGMDAPLDPPPLKAAWPEGAACLVSPQENSRRMTDALLHFFRQGVPALRGVSAGIQSGTDPQWRFRFHCQGDEADANYSAKIGDGWDMATHPHGRAGNWVAKYTSDFDESSLSELFTKFTNPDAGMVVIDDKLTFPRIPASVRLGEEGEPTFASTIMVRCFRLPGQWQVEVWLDLEDSPVIRPVAHTSRMLLAECAAVPADDGEKFYQLQPPGKPPEEAALQAACQWTLEPSDKKLVAARITPGFVRPEEVSFYAKLAKGDLVWVQVTHGELPLIVGALHQYFKQWEQGEQAADVAIGAHKIDLSSPGKGSQVRLEDKNVVVSVTEKLALDAEKIKAGKAIEIDGPATFNDNVTVT
jgi:hypothetical protein